VNRVPLDRFLLNLIVRRRGLGAMNKKRLKILLCKYFVPLGLGSAIYVACRGPRLLYERLFYYLFGSQWLQVKSSMNHGCAHFLGDGLISQMIVYSLPNALWVMTLCFFVDECLLCPLRVRKSSRIGIYFCLAIVPDLLQVVGFLPGTFDLLDIGSALIGVGVVTSINCMPLKLFE